MELKAVTAAEKLLFIKLSHSLAGDLHNSGELRCKFFKTGRSFGTLQALI